MSDSVAGNCVVIEHNDREHGHLSNFERGCFQVAKDQDIAAEQVPGRIRFSGAAAVQRHLRDRLTDRSDFLVAAHSLPKSIRVDFVVGDHRTLKNHAEVIIGDIRWSE